MNIQTLSLILGIIGTTGTIVCGVVAFVKSRVHIDIEIVTWHQTEDCVFVYAVITNKSHIPISISLISAILDDEDVPCSMIPYVVQYKKLPGEHGKGQFEPVRSLPFPLNLGPLSGVSGYLYFRSPRPISQSLSTHLSLSVHTSRKGQVKVECSLQWDDHLHTRYFQLS